MRHPRIHWLFHEIQRWKEAGVISDYQAAAIRGQYVSKAYGMGKRTMAAMVWSILGGISVALGIILVIANFWPDWSRWLRFTVATMPLIASWVALGWMLYQQKTSIFWREGVAVGNLLASVVALGLIDQLYNVQVSLGAFCVAITACSIPVLLMTRSIGWLIVSGVMMNIALADSEGMGLRTVIFIMGTGMLLVPDVVFKSASSWIKLALSWGVTLGFSAAMVWLGESLHATAFVIFPSIVWATILGVGVYSSKQWSIRMPMVAVSAFGLFLTLFMASFSTIWDEWVRVSIVETPIFITILGGLIGMQLGVFAFIRTHWFRWVLVAPSVVFLLGMILYQFSPSWIFPFIMLSLLSAFLVASIRFGVTVHRRSWINGGLFGFILIMIAKSFGTDMTLLAKVALFLISGGVLITVGYRLNRWPVKS